MGNVEAVKGNVEAVWALKLKIKATLACAKFSAGAGLSKRTFLLIQPLNRKKAYLCSKYKHSTLFCL